MTEADLVRKTAIRVCQAMEQCADELTTLDSTAGDGDLGINLLTGLRVLHGSLSSGELAKATEIPELVSGAGRLIAEHAASTFGTLLSQGVIAAGKALAGPDVAHGNRLNTGFRAALDMIKRRGKAEPGEGTMVDALEPAVRAIEAATDSAPGNDPFSVLKAACEAARVGAEATRSMRSTKGRARWSGTQGEGSVDPGALAVVYLLEAMAENPTD
ncbi:MAG: dihydroxyacetone kinase subunit L [Spirochaetaceae bacterium]|nr:MAG: dihydroxyacetone kinase subunit L [Spirochaetaceae bacterium]